MHNSIHFSINNFDKPYRVLSNEWPPSLIDLPTFRPFFKVFIITVYFHLSQNNILLNCSVKKFLKLLKKMVLNRVSLSGRGPFNFLTPCTNLKWPRNGSILKILEMERTMHKRKKFWKQDDINFPEKLFLELLQILSELKDLRAVSKPAILITRHFKKILSTFHRCEWALGTLQFYDNCTSRQLSKLLFSVCESVTYIFLLYSLL